MKYIIIALLVGVFIGINTGFPEEIEARKINILFKDECSLAGKWQEEKRQYRANIYKLKRQLHLGLY